MDGLKTSEYLIQYLRTLGFDATNDIFAENAWYFRNSLVRANYTDVKNGIYETTEYLEIFLRNLLLNENHPLHNRTLHVSGAFKEIKEPDIENSKPDIRVSKPDIEKYFQPKMVSHILKLREAFSGQMIFGRSDVMKRKVSFPTADINSEPSCRKHNWGVAAKMEFFNVRREVSD